MLSVVCGVWVTYIIQKKSGKKKEKGMNSARLEPTPSNPESGIATMLPYYQRSIFLFFVACARRATHRTHMFSTEKVKEAVITDDGSQPPIEQLATAAHRVPATRSWCGLLLLVLLGGVVMLVFSACCLMSIFLG